MEKKVAIIGFGLSRDQAPYQDESFEIWGLNDLYDKLPRWTRWFDIHDWDSKDPNSIKTHKTNRAKLQKVVAYQQMENPIYCQEAWPEIPRAIKYPLQEVEDSFCGGKKGYFTNQVSYMIALALLEGFQEIHLYGIDMAMDGEYEHQRPSVEYWVGVARGMGVEFYIPESSSLMKVMWQYGYEQEKSYVFMEECKSRLDFLKEKKQEAMGNQRANEQAVDQYAGAIGDLEHTIKVWGNVQKE